MQYGSVLRQPVYGAIAIMDHGLGKGHVGFVAGRTTSGDLVILGGNQNDHVYYAGYSQQKFVRFVYPSGYKFSYQQLPIQNLSVSGDASIH